MLTKCLIERPMRMAGPVRCAYELRLSKYAWRGYALAVPGLDHSRIDQSRLHGRLSELSGLLRLIRIERVLELGGVAPQGAAQGIDMWPKEMLYNSNLDFRDAFYNALDEEDKPALGHNFGYDDVMEGHLIFPTCFNRESNLWATWTYGSQPIGGVRDEAWGAILEASPSDYIYGDPDFSSIPKKLLDAWDSSKRSREYLNAHEHDCAAKYYGHAMSI
jgi:hypothetical protein